MSTPTGSQAADVNVRSTHAAHALSADHVATDQTSALARSALALAVRAHAGERRVSDGARFIEHPLEVQRLLRAASCSDSVAIAGLLHDVVERTPVSAAELTARFGPEIAELVRAVSDDLSVLAYRQRKQMLREQVRNAGRDVALLFCADKISKVRELPDHIRRDRARFDSTPRDSRAADRMRSDQQMRLEYYHASLAMLQRAAPGHPARQPARSRASTPPDQRPPTRTSSQAGPSITPHPGQRLDHALRSSGPTTHPTTLRTSQTRRTPLTAARPLQGLR
jgi:hypothetical protein